MGEDLKNLTWADLKRIVNRIPASRLKDDVTIWTDDEKCYAIADVEVLKEDYVYDGDEGVAPRSVMKNSVSKEEWKEMKDDCGAVYPKGSRIINAAS